CSAPPKTFFAVPWHLPPGAGLRSCRRTTAFAFKSTRLSKQPLPQSVPNESSSLRRIAEAGPQRNLAGARTPARSPTPAHRTARQRKILTHGVELEVLTQRL